MRTRIFKDEEFVSRMQGEVEEWRKAHLKSVRLHSYDGTKLHGYYALNPEGRAAIVLVHGFTEYAEKFLETLYYFYQEGYSVFMADQRGHGRSGRKVENEELVHVGSFDEYVEDLWEFVNRVVAEQAPGLPRLLYAHSMGGCIGALFLERHPDVFEGAVLTSPMLKMTFGAIPFKVAQALAASSRVFGRKVKPAPGFAGFSEVPDFENTCATSEVRYLYTLEQQIRHRAYRTCGATYGWVDAALAATKEVQECASAAVVPIFLCQAGIDTLVDNAGQDSFAAAAPHVTIMRFPEAKHEIYRSPEDVLKRYYEEIFTFYEQF